MDKIQSLYGTARILDGLLGLQKLLSLALVAWPSSIDYAEMVSQFLLLQAFPKEKISLLSAYHYHYSLH